MALDVVFPATACSVLIGRLPVRTAYIDRASCCCHSTFASPQWRCTDMLSVAWAEKEMMMEWDEELHQKLDGIAARLDALMVATRPGYEINTGGVEGVLILPVGTEV